MTAFIDHLRFEVSGLKEAGLYKSERIITSKQAGEISVASGQRVLNFCANNYLGLADNEELAKAGKTALDRYGFGMASVRFICGTQEEHKALETRIAEFLGMEVQSSMPLALTRMAGCSRLFSDRKMRSFRMR